MSDVRVRFAPSPTGYLHIGGARTALFNWLFAKKLGGKLILRIEDTDTKRLKEDSVSQILTSLKWLGLSWDEGPEKGGEFGPYFQSERLPFYKKMAEKLLLEGRAYYCFCTEEELLKTREKQKSKKEAFRYERTCRNLTKEEVAKNIAEGKPYSIRIKIPSEGEIIVKDLIHGEVRFDLGLLDDFVIVKSNGMPTYNFAVVVDDYMMKINYVLRAEEHLSNTPKQILIYKALGFKVPNFGHMPMILAPDRSKLSKRHGATSVEEFKEQGYLPQAIINYLTLLGWAPEGEKEIFAPLDTVKEFDLEKMSKKAAVYDTKKLTWMNGQYLASLPIEKILPEVIPFFINKGLLTREWINENNEYFIKLLNIVRVRVKTLVELTDACTYFFKDVDGYDEKGVKKYFKEDTIGLLETCKKGIENLEVFNLVTTEELYKKIAADTGISFGKVIHPTRLSLTGRTVSPGMFDVMVLLGRDVCIKRIEKAIEYIKTNYEN
jgi:glutamyl-tRNA synthetase